MTIKHPEIEIDLAEPFKSCKLEREKYADILTSLVGSYSDGFVLAINNKWGTGKTTFVKMWQQQLRNHEYETIYFNAWENDFEDNPLTALLGELKTITKSSDANFKKVVKSAAKLSKNVAPAVAKALLNKYIDTEVIVEAITESLKATTEIFEEEVNDYATRKKSISDFKNDLAKFVEQNTSNKPLIFIIDELDRCRPNYAVSLLEQVKHFFTVKNIVFILSIDKIQLGNAICGVYGSEKIDSAEYLKRFIDVEYTIPNPSNGKYFNYLYQYLDFDSFLTNRERTQHYEFQYDKDSFISTFKLLFADCTLRQLEKIMFSTRLILRTLSPNNYLFPTFFLFLVYIKFLHFDYYENIIQKKYSIKDLQNKYYELFTSKISKENERVFVEIEACLLVFYTNYISQYRGLENIYKYNRETSKTELTIDSCIDNNLLLEYFENNDRGFLRSFELSLKYFIERIELSENFKM